MEKVLITGITGSGGSYLAEHLSQKEEVREIYGIARWHSTTSQNNLKSVSDLVTVRECDLNDFSSTFRVLKDFWPDTIFHLASHANVKSSFANPLSVLSNNVQSTANLLEAVRLTNADATVHLCSTSEVYGQVHSNEVPIAETNPIRASSPYAVSKVTQDLLGLCYFNAYGLKVVRTRMFTYLNPRRHDLFATSFARQIARIEAGLQTHLMHGNLESTRTVLGIKDAMEAYYLAAKHGKPGEVYNIGGTTTLSVGDFLMALINQAQVPIFCKADPNLMRPSDVTRQIPDVSKFITTTGWAPKQSFDEALGFLLFHARQDVKRELAMGAA